MKLIGIKEISGKIILKSGLHIGAGDAEMKIGGTDNPVVKHPHTLEPYIPGSSLKGKVRSLLEMRSGMMARTKGEPLSLKILNAQDLDDEQKRECENIIKLFGASGADTDDSGRLGPTRASFADCPLDANWRKQALDGNLPLTEIKSENTINRVQGNALNPRFTERVPAGAEFAFSITVKQLSPDENLEDLMLEGLKMLETDAIGGSGSRGYGQIEFEFSDPAIGEKFNALQPL
jgi:CRISPR-associated protein Csm3